LVSELLTLKRDDLYKPSLLVVGCSTSEIAGGRIGKDINPAIGEAVAQAILEIADGLNIDAAFQCCEHLNRALVMDASAADRRGYNPVCAVPYPEAGGSCAAAAYRLMKNPILIESVQGDAGIDIGQTLIGMHLRPVAVPVRLSLDAVGMARITAARSRAKFIGGVRTKYQ
jgi:uncharacterized protein (TIGR01440 family)